jgi:hypothetical protein
MKRRQLGPSWPTNIARTQKLAAGGWAILVSVLVSCAGCYDGATLVEMARAEAIQSEMDEIDLGAYQTTLPRDPMTAVVTEIQFQIFGNAPRYRSEQVKEQLKSEGYRLRYATLTAVRQAAAEEFAEPDLTTLRRRLKDVANEVFDDAPISSIGFEKLSFTRR